MRSSSSALIALFMLLSAVAAADDEPEAFFLVASPRITDPNFRQTVVLIIQHSAMVSRGVIINRPLDTPLARLSPGDKAFEQAKERVYFGGPVALPNLSFVFRARQRPKGSVHVIDDLFIADDPKLLRDMLKGKGAAGRVRVYAGHASWGPGQLQSEIEGGGWFATRATPDFVFHENPESIWGELVMRASQRSVQVETGIGVAADFSQQWRSRGDVPKQTVRSFRRARPHGGSQIPQPRLNAAPRVSTLQAVRPRAVHLRGSRFRYARRIVRPRGPPRAPPGAGLHGCATFVTERPRLVHDSCPLLSA